MEWLLANASLVYDIVVQVVGVAALVATLTPNDNDNKVIASILKFVNLLGANFGKAKNEIHDD